MAEQKMGGSGPTAAAFETKQGLSEEVKAAARRAMDKLDDNVMIEIIAGLQEAGQTADGTLVEAGGEEGTADVARQLKFIKGSFLGKLDAIQVDASTAEIIAAAMASLEEELSGGPEQIRAKGAKIHEQLMDLEQYFIESPEKSGAK